MQKALIMKFKGIEPEIAQSAFLTPMVSIVGDVKIGERSSVWFNTVIRGDVNFVRIGKDTNIQDNSMIHVTHNGNPTIIGDQVTVGHSATLHACTIKDRVLIGMGAVILDGAVINEDSVVAAGSLVPPGKTYPPRSMIMGSPAKVTRELTEKEIEGLVYSANHYINICKGYES